MGFGANGPIESGVVDLSSLKDRRNSDSETPPGKGASYLAGHPAVVLHGKGSSTDDFASFAESFADYSRSRIRGIGAAQYDNGKGQKYEDFDFNDVAVELLDELADAQNYIAILAVKTLAILGKGVTIEGLAALVEAEATNE